MYTITGEEPNYVLAQTFNISWLKLYHQNGLLTMSLYFGTQHQKNELDKISKSPDLKTDFASKARLKMQKIGHFAQVRLCITDYMCMIIINGILYCVSLILHKRHFTYVAPEDAEGNSHCLSKPLLVYMCMI